MPADTAMIHVATICAVVAALSAWRGARHGVPMMRPLAAATGALATVYVIAYLVLLVMWGETDDGWSRFMRGVAIVAWLTVWAGWPWMSVRAWRAARRRVDEIGGPDDRSG